MERRATAVGGIQVYPTVGGEYGFPTGDLKAAGLPSPDTEAHERHMRGAYFVAWAGIDDGYRRQPRHMMFESTRGYRNFVICSSYDVEVSSLIKVSPTEPTGMPLQ